jgi:hypothetical protein
MRVPDEILKSVVFIGSRENDQPVYRGTAFLVGVDGAYGSPSWIFLVTARHIASRLYGSKFIVRVNTKDGPPLILDGDGSRWWFHPTDPDGVDVAVTTWALPAEVNQTTDISTLPLAMFVNQSTFDQRNIGIGDPVFIAGLFSSVQRTTRNIPIVRSGNLAMIPNERIPFGERMIEAYLIEARSIGGLSGSPVFVRSTLHLQGFVDHHQKPVSATVTSRSYYLLGSMIGHWDLGADQPLVQKERVNMGISAVVPADRIAEVIDHPELVALRKTWDEDVIRKKR